ncbi:hypothetical protein PVAP13_7NG078979 [Panicum virgatum]|uniref:Uncharacterized protein n=1 Tax=Panicum virgatum TaxID=38727 RepID=A0A8T0PQL0_PANVG|nr:hypothetical protein PVAP13_7NG078979 [Panicum virgatum]
MPRCSPSSCSCVVLLFPPHLSPSRTRPATDPRRRRSRPSAAELGPAVGELVPALGPAGRGARTRRRRSSGPRRKLGPAGGGARTRWRQSSRLQRELGPRPAAELALPAGARTRTGGGARARRRGSSHPDRRRSSARREGDKREGMGGR